MPVLAGHQIPTRPIRLAQVLVVINRLHWALNQMMGMIVRDRAGIPGIWTK